MYTFSFTAYNNPIRKEPLAELEPAWKGKRSSELTGKAEDTGTAQSQGQGRSKDAEAGLDAAEQTGA